jgi:hypothetical protein
MNYMMRQLKKLSGFPNHAIENSSTIKLTYHSKVDNYRLNVVDPYMHHVICHNELQRYIPEKLIKKDK